MLLPLTMVSHYSRKVFISLIPAGFLAVFVFSYVYVYSPENRIAKDLCEKIGVESTGKPAARRILTEREVEDAKIVNRLANEMHRKLSLSKAANTLTSFPNHCQTRKGRGNSCDGPSNRLTISDDVTTRISQIVEPPHLQLAAGYRRVLAEMRSKVKTGPYAFIVATAASDNHYKEAIHLIDSLQRTVLPHVKNATFLFYDLGLSKSNRAQLADKCKASSPSSPSCQFLDFPFHLFPPHVKKLTCYSWKTAIIKAHLKQTDVIMWVDTCVRLAKYSSKDTNTKPSSNPKPKLSVIEQLIQQTKQRGMVLQYGAGDVASRTMPTTYHFFGEEACAYLQIGEIAGGFGLYNNEYFVDRLVLEPWMVCALDRRCMCPTPFPELNAAKSQHALKDYTERNKSMVYGLAHRFDQSALNLLVVKLYKERFYDLIIPDGVLGFKRG